MRVVRGIVWVAAVLAAGLACALTGWVPMLAIAVAAVLVPIVGWIAAGIAARSMDVALASATTASKSAPVELRLTLRNPTRIPLAHVRVAVRAENLLTGEASTLTVTAAAPPRKSVDASVQLESAYCGRIACTVRDVRVFEPFRIFSRRAACAAERRFTVMPELHEAHLRDVYAASPLSDTTVFSPYVKGSDLSEVFALREYEEGDELKRIHWKLSEKIDRMIVRDASLPLDNALLLFWDKGFEKKPLVATDDRAPAADAMAEVVLALMEQLARAGVSFEVASNDIPSGSCPRAFVTDEADIYEVIGQLLSAPVCAAPTSGLDEYLRFYGNLSCSRLIYVCSQRPGDLENALGTIQTLLLVCDGTEEMVARPQIAEIHFPPGSAREALEMAGAM